MTNLKLLFVFALHSAYFAFDALAIYCYECTSGNDQTCGRFVGTSCPYGFFGCIKIATFSGGVDKLGNFINDPRSVVSMVRGCNLLPVGGVDACQQQVILGYRIVTCYCYSDYCNAGTTLFVSGASSTKLLAVFGVLVFLLLRDFH